jgi:hypothetical protein
MIPIKFIIKTEIISLEIIIIISDITKERETLLQLELQAIELISGIYYPTS